MTTKRAPLFPVKQTSQPATAPAIPQDNTPASPPASMPASSHVDLPATKPYPKATTRQGKKAVTVYVEPETKRQLDKMVFEAKGDNPDFALQDLMIEALNALFAKRGVTRLAS